MTLAGTGINGALFSFGFGSALMMSSRPSSPSPTFPLDSDSKNFFGVLAPSIVNMKPASVWTGSASLDALRDLLIKAIWRTTVHLAGGRHDERLHHGFVRHRLFAENPRQQVLANLIARRNAGAVRID